MHVFARRVSEEFIERLGSIAKELRTKKGRRAAHGDRSERWTLTLAFVPSGPGRKC